MKVHYDSVIGETILKLETTGRAKVAKTIALLEMFGVGLRLPHSKKMSTKLFELRIKGKEEIRIFYTIQNAQAVLLHLFKKKTQKTPVRELAKAQKRLKQLEGHKGLR